MRTGPLFEGVFCGRVNCGLWQSISAPLVPRWFEMGLVGAGGLRDLPDAAPGRGYTGHSFNDYNHCDLTTMNDSVAQNENRGQV